MPTKDQADTGVQTGTIAVGAAASSAFDISDYRSGMLKIPAEMDGNAFAIHASIERGGTYKAIEDSSGNALSMSFALDTWMQVPAAAFGAKFIKFVSSSNEDPARDLTLMLKS